MTVATVKQRYRPTESKYKGGAQDMYVTYDLDQKTRGDHHAVYHKVKRVYIAGKVTNWKSGTFKKRSGREVFGVEIQYEQTRAGFHREAFKAHRNEQEYQVSPAQVKETTMEFRQIVEVPEKAENIRFYLDKNELPEEYKSALQSVRSKS